MRIRTRLLRPGFFQNEDLARLPDKARLLFAGLWLVADRAGRLEDRPGRIKAAVFPYELVDVDPLLHTLAAAGFIARYVGANGDRYIHVTKFLTHQHPHHREPASTLPSPNEPPARLGRPPNQPGGASSAEPPQPNLDSDIDTDPDDSAETLSKNTKPRHGRGKVGAAPEKGEAAPQPSRVDTDTDTVQVQDQDQPAAPAFFSDAADREETAQFKTYAAIYSAVLQDFARDRQRDDPGAADEAFKSRCAKQGLPYDAEITRKAGDAARVARDKKAAALEGLFARGVAGRSL